MVRSLFGSNILSPITQKVKPIVAILAPSNDGSRIDRVERKMVVAERAPTKAAITDVQRALALLFDGLIQNPVRQNPVAAANSGSRKAKAKGDARYSIKEIGKRTARLAPTNLAVLVFIERGRLHKPKEPPPIKAPKTLRLEYTDAGTDRLYRQNRTKVAIVIFLFVIRFAS